MGGEEGALNPAQSSTVTWRVCPYHQLREEEAAEAKSTSAIRQARFLMTWQVAAREREASLRIQYPAEADVTFSSFIPPGRHVLMFEAFHYCFFLCIMFH